MPGPAYAACASKACTPRLAGRGRRRRGSFCSLLACARGTFGHGNARAGAYLGPPERAAESLTCSRGWAQPHYRTQSVLIRKVAPLLTVLLNLSQPAASRWRSVFAAILLPPLLVSRCMRRRCAAGARDIAPAEDAPARTSPGPLPPCWAGSGVWPPSHLRIAPQPPHSHPCNALAPCSMSLTEVCYAGPVLGTCADVCSCDASCFASSSDADDQRGMRHAMQCVAFVGL